MYSIFSNDYVFGSCVKHFGYSDNPTVTRFGPCIRNFVIIHYCTAGKGYFNGNAVNKGEGFIIRPGDFEEYHPDNENPWTFLWFVIESDKYNDFLSFYKENPKTHIFNYNFIDEIKLLQNELSMISARNTDTFYSLHKFLDVLELHNAQNTSQTKNAAKKYAVHCKQYIEFKYNQNILISDIAKSLNISESYLYRCFMNEYSISPKQYIIKCRMNIAKKLLKNKEMNITEVGLAVGYDDVLAFSRAFKLYNKISPKSYKNQ